MLARTFMCGYSANSWNTNAMSRCDARLNVTSSSPSRMRPDVGNSRPAIMRSVVVLPQPEGPSRQKNSPLRTVNVESRTAVKSPNAFWRCSMRISAIDLVRELRNDHEQRGPGQRRDERPGVERQRERLQQHQNTDGNDGRGDHLRRSATQPARPAALQRLLVGAHLRSAPNVIPRSRCLRKSTVKTRIGNRNSVEPAATAGQSCPPSPMMIGMNGGAVCASPEVNSTANAYSFHAKMRQKIAVATMPVVACGSTTLKNACSLV